MVAWTTVDGPPHGGVVTFLPVDQATTRVMVVMQYEPGTFAERAGTAFGMVENRIGSDLVRFKNFIERRGHETGAWRGAVGATPPTTPIPAQSPPETETVLGDMPNTRSEP